MPVRVREIARKRDIRRFVDLPWSIYRKDPHWIPPLKSEMWSIVTGKDNPLLACGRHALFLAENGKRTVGRVMASIDNHLNAARGRGYFSLFESCHEAAATGCPGIQQPYMGSDAQWKRSMSGRACTTCTAPGQANPNWSRYRRSTTP